MCSRGGEGGTSKKEEEESDEVDRSCIPPTFQKGTISTPSSVAPL